MKLCHVYILTNPNNRVLYVGFTCRLRERILEHKQKLNEGFSKKYNLNKLVYFEECDGPSSGILREKQLKAGSRAKKIQLIESMNKEWRDLFEDL